MSGEWRDSIIRNEIRNQSVNFSFRILIFLFLFSFRKLKRVVFVACRAVSKLSLSNHVRDDDEDDDDDDYALTNDSQVVFDDMEG